MRVGERTRALIDSPAKIFFRQKFKFVRAKAMGERKVKTIDLHAEVTIVTARGTDDEVTVLASRDFSGIDKLKISSAVAWATRKFNLALREAHVGDVVSVRIGGWSDDGSHYIFEGRMFGWRTGPITRTGIFSR